MRKASALLWAIFLAPSAIAQVPTGDPFQIAQETGSGQDDPRAAAQGDGTFIVVWSALGPDGDGHGVRARRFSDFGVPLTDEFGVNESTTGTQRRPDVATDASGNFVVVWRNYPGGQPAIFARRFGVDGTALGGEFQINQTQLGGLTGPSVSRTADGDFLVSWGYNTEAEILAATFDSAGDPVLPEVAVDILTVPPHFSADVSGGLFSDGGFGVAWTDYEATEGLPPAVVFQRRFSSTGEPLGPSFQMSSPGPYDYDTAWSPEAHVTPGNDFVVVWNQHYAFGYRSAKARVTTAAGDVGPTRIIQTFTSQAYSSMVPAGEFVVVDSESYPLELGGNRGIILDSSAGFISSFPIPFFDAFLRGVVATRNDPSTIVLLTEDGNANLFGQTFSNRFFADGFETGDTSAWSTTVP